MAKKTTPAPQTATPKTATTKPTKAATSAGAVAAASPTPPLAAPAVPAPAPPKDVAEIAGIIEEATLNWTDLTGAKTGASTLGSNKFYKARLTEGGGQFVVTFTYGRVGQAGQVSIELTHLLEVGFK